MILTQPYRAMMAMSPVVLRLPVKGAPLKISITGINLADRTTGIGIWFNVSAPFDFVPAPLDFDCPQRRFS
jgi:hypothetical protein